MPGCLEKNEVLHMKNTFSVLFYALLGLNLFYPAGTTVCAIFGLELELFSITAFSAATAVLSVMTAIYYLRHKSGFSSKARSIASILVTPAAVVNMMFYLYGCVRLHIILFGFVSVGCCFFLTLKHGKPFALKTFSLVLSGLAAFIIFAISPLILIFGNFGVNTVEQIVESPGGGYYAEVINSDGGALGGDTIVDVHKKGSLDFLIFKISKRTQRVYVGEWGEFYDMEIYWKNEQCLVINSSKYEIE